MDAKERKKQRKLLKKQRRMERKGISQPSQNNPNNNKKNQDNRHNKKGNRKKSIPFENKVEEDIGMFSHLSLNSQTIQKVPVNSKIIHPSMIRLGYKYFHHQLEGSNARALGILDAIKDVVEDYKTPWDKVMGRDLNKKLDPQIEWINSCREMCVSMRNAVRFVKRTISVLPPNAPEDENKKNVLSEIDNYKRQKISFAIKRIIDYFSNRIQDGDVILTYGTSEVIEQILIQAFQKKKKKFSVVIVGGRPTNIPKDTLDRLNEIGISCQYVLINAVSHMMKKVSYFLVGVSACFSNGFVLGRIGTAVVAMTAKNFNVPVLVCCQTIKFTEKTQLASITFNELNDPFEVSKTLPDKKNVQVLNMFYDLTPIEYIDAIVTELGWLPPTSVPVILRESKKEFYK